MNKNDCSRVFPYIFCTAGKTKRSLIPLLIRLNVFSSFLRNYWISDVSLLSKIIFYFFWLGFLFQNNQQIYRIINHFRLSVHFRSTSSLPVIRDVLIECKKSLDSPEINPSFKIKLAFFIKIFIRFPEWNFEFVKLKIQNSYTRKYIRCKIKKPWTNIQRTFHEQYTLNTLRKPPAYSGIPFFEHP